jgi:hypothetical protein
MVVMGLMVLEVEVVEQVLPEEEVEKVEMDW